MKSLSSYRTMQTTYNICIVLENKITPSTSYWVFFFSENIISDVQKTVGYAYLCFSFNG